MVVGTGMIILRIHDCRSLKEKRRVVKSVIRKIQNAFNASVAEVGAHDRYQRAQIGISLVGSDQRLINAKLDKIINHIDDLGLAEILESEMEIMIL